MITGWHAGLIPATDHSDSVLPGFLSVSEFWDGTLSKVLTASQRCVEAINKFLPRLTYTTFFIVLHLRLLVPVLQLCFYRLTWDVSLTFKNANYELNSVYIQGDTEPRNFEG